MNTTDTIQVTDKLVAGLQGFVTLVNDPHQIKAFYDLPRSAAANAADAVL